MDRILTLRFLLERNTVFLLTFMTPPGIIHCVELEGRGHHVEVWTIIIS